MTFRIFNYRNESGQIQFPNSVVLIQSPRRTAKSRMVGLLLVAREKPLRQAFRAFFFFLGFDWKLFQDNGVPCLQVKLPTQLKGETSFVDAPSRLGLLMEGVNVTLRYLVLVHDTGGIFTSFRCKETYMTRFGYVTTSKHHGLS